MGSFDKLETYKEKLAETVRASRVPDDDAKQRGRWEKLARYFSKHASSNQLLEAYQLVIRMTSADQDRGAATSLNSVKTYGKGYERTERMAILTSAGRDKLVRLTGRAFKSPLPPVIKAGTPGGFIVVDAGEKGIPLPVSLKMADPTQGPTPDDDVTYGESATTRMQEMFRYIPISLSAYILVVVMHVDGVKVKNGVDYTWGDKWNDILKYMCVSVLYHACEVRAMSHSSVLKSDSDFSPKDLLTQWAASPENGKPSGAAAPWMLKWSRDNGHNYVTAPEAGFSGIEDVSPHEFSRGVIDKQLRGAMKHGRTGITMFEKTKVAFLEASVAGEQKCVLTAKSATNAGFLRCFIAMNCGLRSYGMCDKAGSDGVFGMSDFYTEMMVWACKYPGALGKKLTTACEAPYKYIIAHPKFVHVPDVVGYGLKDAQTLQRKKYADLGAKALLEKSLDVRPGSSWDQLMVASAGDTPLTPSLIRIMRAWRGLEFSPSSRDVLDVLSCLAHPGVVEGYGRGSKACLAVDGYISKTVRLVVEKVDSDAVPADHAHLSAMYQGIANVAVYKPLDEARRDMIRLAKSASAGKDFVKADVPLSAVTRGRRDEEFRIKMKKKNVVVAFMAHLIATLTLIWQVATWTAPYILAYRSVPARVLRFVYVLPMYAQIISMPMYEASVKVFKSDRFKNIFSSGNEKGMAIYDFRDLILASIRMTHSDEEVAIAHDASKMDMHEGAGDRAAIIAGIDAVKVPLGGDVVFQAFRAMLLSWAKNYFLVAPENSPTQLLEVDSLLSGWVMTSIANSIKSYSVMSYVFSRSVVPMRMLRILGDDLVVTIAVRPENIVDVVSEHIASARLCGQVYNSFDAVSGRLLHYLQKLYVWGQISGRCMALDSENSDDVNFNSLGAMVDKYVKLCGRGGNALLMDALLGVVVYTGSSMATFGTKINVPVSAFFLPDGPLNRQPFGFPSPNSKVWLAMHSANAGSDFKMPQVERPEKVGASATSHMREMHCTVNGIPNLQKTTPGDLLKASASALLYPELLKVGPFKGYEEFAYSNSCRRLAMQGVGDKIITDSPARRFLYEEALSRAGLRGEGERSMRMVAIPTLPSLTSEVIHVSFGKYELHKRDDGDFELVDVSMNQQRSVITYRKKWTPFLGRERPVRDLLSLLGVGFGEDEDSKALKGLTGMFTPHARRDLSAEAVMSHVLEISRAQGDVNAYLLSIGMTASEALSASDHIGDIVFVKKAEEVQDYGATPSSVEAYDRAFVAALISETSPGVQSVTLNRYISAAYHRLFVGLLYDEVNYHLALDSASRVFARVPTFSYVAKPGQD